MGLITKGSNGKGLATTGIVRDSRQAGSSILELQSTKNFVDNNELFHFAQWTADTVNKPVPGTLIEGTAKLIGSGQVSIESLDHGFTDIGSSIGDIFMIKPTTGWVNDLYDALTETLNQDGTLRDDVLEEITASKQDTLVSGTNIRTVNNQSLVGSGNINVLEVPEGGVLGQVVKKQAEGYGWEDESGGSSKAIIVQNTEPDPDPSVIWVNPDESTEGSEVVSVNGKTGDVVLTKADLGLNNVNNTTDLNKPVSTATQTALDAKANVYTTPAVVNHGSTADTTRPSAILVIWRGSVEPTNKQAGDIWVEV